MKGILQGEALLNDASGLVSFKFALAAAMTGLFSLPQAAGSLLVIGIGGLLVGAALAWLLDWTLRLVAGGGSEETATENVLMLLLPLGAFLLAEHVGASGILSAVAAGLMMDRVRFFNRGSAELRTQGRFIWGLVEFSFNGIIFVLLGLYVPVALRAAIIAGAHGQRQLGAFLLLIGAVTLALVVLRFVWVCITLPIEGWLRQRPAWQWPGFRAILAVSLGGLRGAIALAGILSLPRLMPDGSPIPSRDMLIELVVGVILLSLLMGAIGLPLVLRGLRYSHETPAEQVEQAALVDAAKAALRAVRARHTAIALSTGSEDAALCEEAAKGLIAHYERLIRWGSDGLEGARHELRHDTAGKLASYARDLRLAGLRAAHHELNQAHREGRVDDRALRAVTADLDLQELAIRGRATSG